MPTRGQRPHGRPAAADLDALRELDPDNIIVVAHSLGAAVSYRALLQAHAREDVCQLVTVGNGIRVVHADAGSRLELGLPGVPWLDLHTSFDPVPAGPLRFEIDTAVSVRVSNHQSPLSDHTTYFANNEEVNGRIIAATLEHAFAPPLFADFRSRVEQLEGASGPQVDAVRHGTGIRPRIRTLAFATSAQVAALGGTMLRLDTTILPRLPEMIERQFSAAVTGWLTVFVVGVLALFLLVILPFSSWDHVASDRFLGSSPRLHHGGDALLGIAAGAPALLTLLVTDSTAAVVLASATLAVTGLAVASTDQFPRAHDLRPPGLLHDLTSLLAGKREDANRTSPTPTNP